MYNEEQEIETLTIEDIDILASLASDISENINDLISCIREIKDDIDNIKMRLNN